MKQWLRPQVNVEKFVANEFVSACPESVVDSETSFAADLVIARAGAFNPSKDPDRDGVADGIFNDVLFEAWKGGSTINSAQDSLLGDVYDGWHTNKKLYKRLITTTESHVSYSNTTYFKELGTFDIYIRKGTGRPQIYSVGSHSTPLIRNIS